MTTTLPAEPLDLDDIQGLVVRGFGKLPEARFLLLAIPADATAARARLADAVAHGDVNTARSHPRHHDRAVQLAFTATGLARLGLDEHTRGTFSREFLEGMDDDVRAEALGDRGDNDPATWRWGRRGTANAVDVMVMVYAKDRATLRTALEPWYAAARAGAFRWIAGKGTHARTDQKEHFGWRDGISLPTVAGMSHEHIPGAPHPRRAQENWTPEPLATGEFVLGYRNEYAAYTESPYADPARDPHGVLPPTADGAARDLGKNGTYLIYRQMTQDVPGLWRYLVAQSREAGDDEVARAIALGSKMVGRWPGGAPLVLSPKHDDPHRATANAFTFAKPDPVGLACPIGSHIRRANPRDQLGSGRDASDSTIMVRKHQMIRRGRPFGPPITPTLDPRSIVARGDDGVRRGLHFVCLVGHISRQFEFVQRAWIDSPNFQAMFRDGDPIVAPRRPRAAGVANPNDEFTCPAVPVRRKYTGMPPFTRVVGGAYFFLPGVRALRFLLGLPRGP